MLDDSESPELHYRRLPGLNDSQVLLSPMFILCLLHVSKFTIVERSFHTELVAKTGIEYLGSTLF